MASAFSIDASARSRRSSRDAEDRANSTMISGDARYGMMSDMMVSNSTAHSLPAEGLIAYVKAENIFLC